MKSAQEPLPKTVSLLKNGVAEGLHLGAQLYLSLQSATIADLAIGESEPGVFMGTDTIMPWLSSTKPVAAVAIGQLWEQGKLDLDYPVSRFIPEFANQGKGEITVRHLLTHTGGFRTADQCERGTEWATIIDCICNAPLEPGWVPGKKAGYHLSGSWYLLGELVRRLDGRPFENYVRDEIFEPVGMRDSWIGMSPDQYRQYGDRIGLMYITEHETPELHPALNTEFTDCACRPGSGGRGPIRELGHFYEMLLGFRREPPISAKTVSELTSRQRRGQFDHTFKHVIDWGLGFIVNSNQYGSETVPYGYGRHCSAETFGHSGSQSSSAFADPAHGLVAAWVCNGMPGERRHQKRARELNSAIYEDLKLG